MSYLFLTGSWKFAPPCLDACDSNDDGRVDLADAVYLLRYPFKLEREPREPVRLRPWAERRRRT